MSFIQRLGIGARIYLAIALMGLVTVVSLSIGIAGVAHV
jgi:hypothetical protein